MKGRKLTFILICVFAMFLPISGKTYAEEQLEIGAPVSVNADGGMYYHTTRQCGIIHEKYQASMRAFPLEEAEVLLERIKPCYLCFGSVLIWDGEAEAEEALPYLAEHLKGVYGENGEWEVLGWKISSTENVLLFFVQVEDRDVNEIIMAKAINGWFPVAQVMQP